MENGNQNLYNDNLACELSFLFNQDLWTYES